MKLRRIVHIITTLRKGGAERLVVDLCNEMAKNSHVEIYLLSLCDNTFENSFVSEINGKVHYHNFGKKEGRSLSVLFRITNFIIELRPDVVHSHLSAIEYVFLSQFLRNRRIQFYHTIHSKAEKECSNPFIKNIRKYFYLNNKITPVTISNDGRISYRKYYSLENDVLINNGRPDFILSDAFEELKSRFQQDESYLLINVGRIDRGKNQALLVKAVRRFNEIYDKKIKLLIVGIVRETDIHENLVKLIDGDPKIQILGGQSNIGDYLKFCDAFCLTSEFEGMPISLIEALSMQCIPICTPVGGIPEMIEDGKTGFLSKDNTVESFFEALVNFHNYKNKNEMARQGRLAFEKNYHISRCAENHLKAYGIIEV